MLGRCFYYGDVERVLEEKRGPEKGKKFGFTSDCEMCQDSAPTSEEMLKKSITLVGWANERAVLHCAPVLVLGIQPYILEGNGCLRLLGLPCRSRITTPWMIWRS